jgi:hypothetical protein
MVIAIADILDDIRSFSKLDRIIKMEKAPSIASGCLPSR